MGRELSSAPSSATPVPTVARSAAGMGLAAAISRGFGALRVLVIAAVLGTTNLGNAFQGSNSFSNVLFELLAAGALSAVLVPTFVELSDEPGSAERLARQLLGVATAVLGAVSVLGMVAAPWIARLLSSEVIDAEAAEDQRRLTTVLLWFFIPQVVMYGFGAVATAVLQSQRRYLVPAAAPIGNTVVMVGFLLAFRAVAGASPGLELSGLEQLLLGLGGTLGVVAFVAAPVVAVRRGGIRLWPSFGWDHPQLRSTLRLSGWASLQHAFAALLLAATTIVGGGVEGGVVAYQVGWFFFLAPYGIVAQPLHTAILNELVEEHGAGRHDAFVASLRWALDSMSVVLVPLTALAVALAVPAMRVAAFGESATRAGVGVLAAALASLSLGLLPYGAFFLLARAWYALGDSRTPAIVGGIACAGGVIAMFAAGRVTDGSATVYALGAAHSAAFLLGSIILATMLRSRIRRWPVPPVFIRVVGVAAPIGAAMWYAAERWAPTDRLSSLLVVIVVGGAGAVLYLAGMRLAGVRVTARLPRPGVVG